MKNITQFQGENRWLSNFWDAEITYEGITYPTVEHAYQANKSTSDMIRKAIAELPYPSNAKKSGKSIVIRDDWEDVKLSIMEDLVRLKFQIPELAEKLKATSDVELIEGNYWNDTFWGVCLKTGTGENNLGKILMRIRDEH
jgi:ribA/ribD-fused uncharacterized protein